MSSERSAERTGYLSANGIRLTKEVPVHYLSKLEE